MKQRHKKTPTVYQMEATECGAASLAMIMGYYGKHISLEKLRIDTGVSRDGCKASKIIACSSNYGFDSKGMKMELSDLKENAQIPCIIHWNFNHFIVYEGIKNGCAYVNDPAIGRRKLTLEELDLGFTGIVLQFTPNANFEKTKQKQTFFTSVKTRVKGQATSIFCIVLLGLLLSFPGIVIPAFTQIFIDDVLIGGKANWIAFVVVGMISMAFLQSILSHYRNYLLNMLQTKLSLISSHTFLTHLFKLPMSFFDQRYTGDISSRVQNNDNVCTFLIGDLAETILNLIVSCIYLILLILYSPILALIGVISVIFNFTVMKIASDKISDSMMKMQQDIGNLHGLIISGLSIINTLKASGTENKYVSRVLSHYAKLISQEQKFGKLIQIIKAVPVTTSQISNVLILMVGSIMVINGNMTLGMLLAFIALLALFTTPVNKIMGFVQKMQEVKSDMNRVNDILDHNVDEIFNEHSKMDLNLEKLKGEIELRDISFGYSQLDKPLITNFNFKLDSGCSVAFVGSSGSGKSTISKIISNLYLPWDGEVVVDGNPILNVPTEIIRSSISTVSQEISLFAGSVRDNITMWNKNILDEDIIQAAKDACIHDAITKKNGAYSYMLTENGKNLSGGATSTIRNCKSTCNQSYHFNNG